MNRVSALPGKGIDDALAVAANAVFMVSIHAVYGFHRTDDCIAQAMWREAYDRGSAPKAGIMYTDVLQGQCQCETPAQNKAPARRPC